MTKDVTAETLLDSLPVQIWSLTSYDTYGRANKAHALFLGLKRDDIENRKILSFLPSSKAEEVLKQNKRVFREKKKVISEEWVNFGAKKAFLRITWKPKVDKKGKVSYVICSGEDITEVKQNEEQARFLSFHDKLTELYNRRFLEEEIERLDTKRQLPISIIVADVNNLKTVNDTYGHEAGDGLLTCAAKILRRACRKEDIIARWGGDEFVILLPKTNKEKANIIAKRIGHFCKKSNQICTYDLKLPVSIAVGTATKTDEKQSIEKMLKVADINMYSNKRDIKNKALQH